MKETKKKVTYTAPVIFFICLLFALGYILLRGTKYTSDDDELMNLIAAGAIGNEDTQVLFFLDILCGYIIKGLYTLLPQVNCYLLFLLMLNFLSIFTLCLLLGKKGDFATCILITIAVNALLSGCAYSDVQYTRNACLYTVVGLAVLFNTILSCKNQKIPAKQILSSIIGSMFLIFGQMMRGRAFLLCLPLAALLIFADFCISLQEHRSSTPTGSDAPESQKQSVFRIVLPTIKSTLLPLLITILLVGGYALCEQYVESNTAGYREWEAFNAQRTRLQDYGFLSYDLYAEEYDEVGITAEDLAMLGTWDHYDESHFTTSLLKTVADIRDRHQNFTLRIDGHAIYMTLQNVKRVTFDNPFALLCFLLLIATAFLRNPGLFIAESAFMAYAYAVYWYLTCRGRFTDYVEDGFWIALLICMTLCILRYAQKPVERSFSYRLSILLLSLVILVTEMGSLGYHYRLVNYSVLFPQADSAKMDFLDSLDEKVNTPGGDLEDAFIYLANNTWWIYQDGEHYLNIWDINCNMENLYEHVCMMGYWLQTSPWGKYTSIQRGYDNPYVTLLSEENVYLAADENEATVIGNYMRRYYDADVVLKEVDEIAGIHLWKVTAGTR